MQCADVLACLVGSTINYQFMPRGGKPEFTGVELAYLLSGATTIEQALALAVYADDRAATRQLQSRMILFAIDLAIKSGYKTERGKPYHVNMGLLSVLELMSPGKQCRWCRGSGTNEGHECDLCRGCGRSPAQTDSQVQRARFVGVSAMEWRRHWKDKYGFVFAHINDVHSSVCRLVARNQIVGY